MHLPVQYLDRKQQEVAVLNQALGAPLELGVPRSVEEAIEQKLKLAATLRAQQSLQSWAVTETARPAARRWRSGAFEFSFGYQRADLVVRGPPVYPSLAATPRFTIYTGSGMSAIGALVTALARARTRIDVLFPADGYGETRELLEGLYPRVRRLSGAVVHRRPRPEGSLRVLWLDSSVRAGMLGEFTRDPTAFDLVVFDTTCLWRGSLRVRRVVDGAHRHGLPLVLVRSHTKLDCLGIEYGRLGSVVFSTAGVSAHGLRRLESLAARVRDAVRLYGASPIPAHFPPFASGPTFDRLSRQRTASIMRSTRRLARRLRGAIGDDVTISAYQHGAYLTIADSGASGANRVKAVAADLAGALAAQGLPVGHAGSFGFDFIAIEWFPDPLAGHDVVRVAGADLPRATTDRVADAIATWWRARRATPRRPPQWRDATLDRPAATTRSLP